MIKPATILKGAVPIVEDQIKQELRDQGHYLTGALERSFKADIRGNVLEGKALDYAVTLNDGIAPEHIAINSQTLAEMTRYVELRMGYRGGKAQRVALLILQKQQQEGNPTKNSYAFSKNGYRKKALELGFEDAEVVLDKHMLSGMDDMMNEAFNLIKSETI